MVTVVKRSGCNVTPPALVKLLPGVHFQNKTHVNLLQTESAPQNKTFYSKRDQMI